MPIADALRRYIIPDVRQVLTRRDMAFYALSVGAAQNPLNVAELQLADPAKGLVPVPSIVAVLCNPGFWIAHPATGVNAIKVLHGEQGFRILRRIPVEGPILGRTRVTGVLDKGAGKSALIYTEKELIDEATGEVFARSTATIVARADGGWGGSAGPVRSVHPIPGTPPNFVADRQTRPEQALYYRLNGDMNPLHADPETAIKAGYQYPILHGLCTMGIICLAVIKELCDSDPTRLRGMDLRFSAPVFPGETIRTEMWSNGSFRARVVDRNVVVINNGKAIVG